MSLSSNTTQMRELNELRDHLKWLDEERRKSSRKMAELEQRLAQQGRDLSDRVQKIQELESQVAIFNQRFDQISDDTAGDPETEQRLQDLEWHISSMNAQLTRMPSLDDEQKRRQEDQAYLQEEIARAISATHERVETSQSILEGQLRSEIAALRVVDDRQELTSQLELQAGELNSLKDAFAELSARLRETTVSIASDTQTHADSLAASVQDQLDRMTAENRSWMDVLAADLNVKQDALNRMTAETQSRIDALSADLDAKLDAKLETLPDRSVDLSGELDLIQRSWDERLHQVEQNVDKIGPVREIMPLLDRIEQELELRQAEELRLSTLIGTQEDRFGPLTASLEEITTSNTTLLNRLADTEGALDALRTGVKDINDNLKPVIIRADQRISPLSERITALSNSAMKTEAGLQAVANDQIELREMIVNSTDELQRNQSEIAHQLDGWQATMDENKDTIERFTQQWITLSNQYKEARMAVQNFAHWQKQLEQQKREASEMLRLESNRMQARWDGFILEIQEKLKNFEIDLSQKWQTFELENEQKWSGARRSEKLWREEIAAVDELIQKLQQDNRNLIWRVQTAQADAIKKWPRLLMEEVEKAVEINPNRRLASTSTLPSAEMSVVDAIEQGLITIDYNDDTDVES